MSKYQKAVKRWFGRIFIRNDGDGRGFQMLVYGCFWMSVRQYDTDPRKFLKRTDHLEVFEDCSIMWSDVMTVSMPRGMF